MRVENYISKYMPLLLFGLKLNWRCSKFDELYYVNNVIFVNGGIPKYLFGVGPSFDTEIANSRPYKIAQTFYEKFPDA